MAGMRNASHPVYITGAGPAGLAAALAARRAGRQVVVHERELEVGHRFHDDFQGLENWSTEDDVLDELAQLGIAPSFEHAPVTRAVVFDPADRVHVYESSRPMFHVVRRGPGEGTLDRALERQAREAGVDIRFGVRGGSTGVAHIEATGPRGNNAIAAGLLFHTTAADSVHAALSDHLAPGGYAYLIINKGRGTLATCMFRRFGEARSCLERTRQYFADRVSFDMLEPRPFGGVGQYGPPVTAHAGSVLYAGEAAGFQDPLWGFGMRYALLSGTMAGRALAEGTPAQYDDAWHQRFGDMLEAGTVNRLLYGRLGRLGYHSLLALLDHTSDPRALLRRLYHRTPLTSLLLGLARRIAAPPTATQQAPRQRSPAAP